ncbi:hypothetical protein EKK58_10970 [Candidatus Dependentiae bacterium]|nr:MAG: hypothetical protein EKK58_10970 [Candidatus Dependentiae bacterium]
MFSTSNLFDFICDIEHYYSCLLLKDEYKKQYAYDYTRYINSLIWPLLKKKFLKDQQDIITSFESSPLHTQLYMLIKWQKNGFKDLLFS